MASFGEGRGLYFATHADIAAVNSDSSLLTTVLETIFKDMGIQPALILKGPGKVMRKHDPHLIETQDRSTILISNALEEDTEVELHLKLMERVVERIEIDFLEQREIDWEVKENRLILNFTMRGKEGEAIDIYWQ
jgi:hypothetical protein